MQWLPLTLYWEKHLLWRNTHLQFIYFFLLIIFIRLTVFGITHTKCSLMFIAPAINGFFPCKTTKIEANGRRSNIHTNIWIRREKIVVHLTVYKRRRYFPFKCNVHGALSPLLRFLYILAFVLSMIAQSEWVIGFFFVISAKSATSGSLLSSFPCQVQKFHFPIHSREERRAQAPEKRQWEKVNFSFSTSIMDGLTFATYDISLRVFITTFSKNICSLACAYCATIMPILYVSFQAALHTHFFLIS